MFSVCGTFLFSNPIKMIKENTIIQEIFLISLFHFLVRIMTSGKTHRLSIKNVVFKTDPSNKPVLNTTLKII